MRLAEPFEIRSLAECAAGASDLADRIEQVSVDIDVDSEERGFFRVIFSVRDLGHVPDGQLERLAKSVEDALIERDDRFPSVRYADAA